ncbi:MAG: ferredoxin--NADP reductase [Pseudomonadota bacterium]|nr:ferredoxin--NADP reductase [Pseudomonadota bacterium]
MAKWIQGKVVSKRAWTRSLLSLSVAAPEVTFQAGQFARLALPAPAGAREEMLGRPYSFVNSPLESPHEFYLIIVPEGPLSPRLAKLEAEDAIWILPRANGFFTVAELPQSRILWCLATGTGIGPFLSILRTPDPWQKFERCVLVHAVRHAEELTYQEVIARMAAEHAGRFTYVPFVSRESHPGTLHGRIPAAILDGRLELRAGVALTAESSHVMLCGNHYMFEDTQATLQTLGMRRHRRKEPGHVTVETYW